MFHSLNVLSRSSWRHSLLWAYVPTRGLSCVQDMCHRAMSHGPIPLTPSPEVGGGTRFRISRQLPRGALGSILAPLPFGGLGKRAECTRTQRRGGLPVRYNASEQCIAPRRFAACSDTFAQGCCSASDREERRHDVIVGRDRAVSATEQESAGLPDRQNSRLVESRPLHQLPSLRGGAASGLPAIRATMDKDRRRRG